MQSPDKKHLPSLSGEESPDPEPPKSQASGLSLLSASPDLIADHAWVHFQGWN